MAHEFKTREETYNFYDWMKKPKNKKYLDKVSLEDIQLSLRSNGLNPKSICLYGNHIDCACNTCRMNRKKERQELLCPSHKQTVLDLRPSKKQTKEQKSQGLWFDCPEHNCSCSILIPVNKLNEVQKIFWEMDEKAKDYHYDNQPDSNVSRWIKTERGY